MAGEIVHSIVADSTPWNATSDEMSKRDFDHDYDEDEPITEMGFADW